MTTVLLLAILIVVLYILYRLPGKGAAGGVRTYRTQATARPVVHGDKLEADALYLWRLKCAGQTASRRAVTRRGEMTAGRWNRASALMAHLRLDPAQTPYAEGAEGIREYIREQRRLARQTTFVPPYS